MELFLKRRITKESHPEYPIFRDSGLVDWDKFKQELDRQGFV